MIFTSKVPLNGAPQPLVAYLCARFTYLSREEWAHRIGRGKLLCNAQLVTAEHIVRRGDEISYIADDFEEPPADLNYRIVFEDAWYLGIDKPGNLLVHRAGKSFTNNLIHQLRHVHVPPYPDAHTAHRIDRETSGVVLVARNTEARTAVQPQFATQSVKKVYVAIVHGVPDESERIIDLPLGKEVNSTIDYKFRVDPAGKQSCTRIEEVTPLGNGFSLLTVHPLTGRTHQIRIHLASTGHPIVGDKLYGLNEREYLRWRDNPRQDLPDLLIQRQALHCASLTFEHPFTKEKCTVVAPVPEDMLRLIEQLGNTR